MCKFRENGNCKLCSVLLQKIEVNDEVQCKDDAFKACSECSCPNTYNYVVGSLTITHLTNKKIDIKELPIYDEIISLVKLGPHCKEGGPGTELKKILSYLRIFPNEDSCDCNFHVNVMNAWGPKRCLNDINTIVDWLEESSKKRSWKWVFNRSVTATLIVFACKLAEGESWSSIFLRLPVICFQKTDQ